MVLSEAAKEKRREYQREYQRKWREKNKDKIQTYNARYWERKAAEADEPLQGA